MKNYFYTATVFLAFFMSGVFTACNFEEVPNPNFINSSNYVRLDSGAYVDYKVQITTFEEDQPFGPKDPATYSDTVYQLREIVDVPFRSINNALTYPLLRYKKELTEANYTLDSVWSTYIENAEVVRTNQTVPLVIFKNPPKINTVWDLNAYNNLDEDEMMVEEIGEFNISDEIRFPLTVRMARETQQTIDNRSYIDWYALRYVYADSVGLVKMIEEKYQLKGLVIAGGDGNIEDQLDLYWISTLDDTLTNNPYCEVGEEFVSPFFATAPIENPFLSSENDCVTNPIFGFNADQVLNWTNEQTMFRVTIIEDGEIKVGMLYPDLERYIQEGIRTESTYESHGFLDLDSLPGRYWP